MKKIWRKEKVGGYPGDDPSLPAPATTASTASHNPPAAQYQRQSIPTIDENPEASADHDASSSLTRVDTSSAYQRRMLNSKSSRSTLNPANNRSNTKNMAPLIRQDWDAKVMKTGWLNRSNAEFADENLKLWRAELKGSHLYIYKPPADLFNVKCFRIPTASELEADQNDQFLTNNDGLHDDEKTLDEQDSILNAASTSPTRSSLRKGSNKNLDDLENLSLNPDDTKSLRSKNSFPHLQAPSLPAAPGSEDDDFTTQSSASLSPSRTSTTQVSSQNIQPPIKLMYYSAKYPHPNLKIDPNSQAIISGDLESLCHSILFNTYLQQDGDNDKVTRHLLSLLPLFGDVSTSLLYFKKYSDIFISDPRTDFKENQEEQAVIPKKTEIIMTHRLRLIVNYIKDNFPGMLLEDSLFKNFWDLFYSLSAHENCDDLKKTIHLKQQELYSLLNQVDEDEGSNVITNELSSQNFLKLDLQEFAQEINKINLKFNKVWNPQSDCSLLFETIHENYSYYRKNPLIFDSTKNLHYLGRLLVSQLFLDPVQSRKSSKRAKIITKWIELGSYFDKIGDMVSWLAIATIICSIPVLRLQKTWDHVDPDIIKTISTDWAPVVFELDRRSMISDAGHRSSYHVIAPQGIGEIYPKENVIPYFGDLYVKKPEHLTVKQCERKTQRVIVSLNRWQEYVNSVQNASGISPKEQESDMSDTSRCLYSLLNYHISCPQLTIDTVMEYSLSVEPSTNGVFNKYHNNSRSPLFLGSYPSVIFPHTLPKYKVYDQKLLIGAIGNDATTSTDNVYHNVKSNQSTIVSSVTAQPTHPTSSTKDLAEHQHLSQLQRPGRNQFLKNVRDIFNIDSYDLRVSGSIIFKAMLAAEQSESGTGTPALSFSEKPEGSSEISFDATLGDHDTSKEDIISGNNHSHNNSSSANANLGTKPRSRPSSVLFNASANVKRYSNYSSNLEDFQNHGKLKNEDNVNEMFAKAATLDRLIDLLILTANIFASEINLDDVITYSKDKSKNANFKMDNGVYTVTFFATYRSFCSTADLLEGLLKRFLGAKSAAVSIYKRRELISSAKTDSGDVTDDYPTWTESIDETHPDYNKVIWKYVAQIQIGILEALITLVKDHYDHFIDDLQIRKIFIDILKAIDDEVIIEWTKVLSRLETASQNDETITRQVSELHEYYDQILTLYKKLRKVYIKKSYKPFESEFNSPTFSSTLIQIPAENKLPSSENTGSIEDFISEFDELVAILFKRISVNDLLQVFEIIEIQAGKTTTGLFNYQMQDLTTPDEALVISDVFGWFASLYDVDDNGIKKDYVVNKFPASVRSIVQLYYKLKTYVVAQITDPKIVQDERIDRMKCILKMLAMARFKMSSVNLFDSQGSESSEVSPHVPSLIETTIINSIISPESRLFSESWRMAGNSFRGDKLGEFKDLESLIPTVLPFNADELKSTNNLTPCIGWLSERLIEIACYIPNMSVSNTRLINFDKRRYAYNCVSNILDLKESVEGEAVSNIENFKFLFKLKDDALFELDEVKETAVLENATADIPSILFEELLEEEKQILAKEHSKKSFFAKQEEERRVAAQRATMSYQLKNSNGNTSSLTNSSNVLSTSISSNRINRRSSMVESPSKARFKFSLFNRGARPFAFGGSSPDRVVRNVDLPDVEMYSTDPRQKPSLMLNLKDMTIFPIYRVPGAFKIDGPNDTAFYFQAMSEQDKEDWIYRLNYSRRHWFYSKSLNKNVSPNMVFGVPIEYICARESSLIPNIIDKLITEIEVRGLEEVGIYRKSASLTVLHLLRTEIDKSGDFNMEHHLIFDINNATGCIKSFLRELPESLIPDELIPEFGAVREDGVDFDGRLAVYKKVLPRLPYHNYHLLKRMIRHLKVVDEFSQFNKMTASNLSTIIGATFTEGANPELTKKYFGLMNFVCEDMIKHYEEIFENASTN